MSIRVHRSLTVLAAVVAALAIWAAATLALGSEVTTPAMGDDAPAPLGVTQVLLASAVAAIAGWASLAALERLTTRATVIWTALAAVVLVLSLGAPLTGEGIAAADRAVLSALHIGVAAVLVPGLRRSRRSGAARDARQAGGERSREVPS